MADVTMPKLSDTMEEGKILRWLKQAGDQVEVGDLLVEVETDKADMEVEASAAGVLREVKLGEGESAAVGAVIAVIDGAGDAARTPAKEASTKDGAGGVAGTKKAAPAVAPQQAPPPAKAAPAPPRKQETPPAPAAPQRAGHEAKVSPLARTLAEELGVDLTAVRGTGPAGRVTRRDVEEAHARAAGGGASDTAAASPPSPAPAAARPAREEPAVASGGNGASPEPVDKPQEARTNAAAAHRQEQETDADAGAAAPRAAGVRRVPLSRMRASIAKRMAESKRAAPHFYLTTVVDMDEAVRLRAQLKTLEVSPAGVTYNHMVVKAAADALVAFPEVNARFADDAIEILDEVNVGIATAVDEGLIVPVLQGADRLSLLEIAAAARALADKAEGGRFSSAELSGATFSVSNLGMFDVDSFSAVINPPQAAILAVGSVKQRPVVRDGALAVGHTMALTLSCDHRVIDGARGGRFLAEVKRRLENPASLLLSGARER